MGNREDLLAAAKHLVVSQGISSTSLRDVAQAAGVSMAAVGYHFGSVQALLTRALVDALDEWGTQFQSSAVPEALGERIDRVLQTTVEHRDLATASIEAAVQARSSEVVRQHLAEGQQDARRGLAAAALGVSEADVEEGAVSSLGSVHLALVTGLMIQVLIDPELAPTTDQVLEGLFRLSSAST